MKKFIKFLFIFMLTAFVIIGGLSIYIGNYIYDYTLNPASSHYLGQSLHKPITSNDESMKWLDEKGEKVSIQSYDHLTLKGRFIENQSDVYVIMVHGYRGNGASIISPIKKMNAQGYNLLIPDLRGHGESEGDYIGMGWDERNDVLSWIDFLLKRKSDISIVLYGVSMGGATVMNVSGENLPYQVKAIIEDCGYTNVWDLFQYHFELDDFQSRMAYQLMNCVTKYRAGYRIEDNQPIRQVQKSKTPLLFIHGSEDDFVPVFMLDELYNAATCEKEKLIVKKAGHANSCAVNEKQYYKTVFHFIDKYTKKYPEILKEEYVKQG